MVLTEIQTLNSVQVFVLLRGKGHQDCSGTISDKFYTAPSSHKKNKQYQCDISVTRCFRWLLQVNLTAIHPLPKPMIPVIVASTHPKSIYSQLQPSGLLRRNNSTYPMTVVLIENLAQCKRTKHP